MQSVAETPIFTRQTEKLFTEDEKRELIDFLAENPLAGDEIPGTGGVRKVRFAASGRGKRGGARIIYFICAKISGPAQRSKFGFHVIISDRKTGYGAQEKRTVT